MNRRGFLAAILASGIAPAFGHAGILMPVRKLILPGDELWTLPIGSTVYVSPHGDPQWPFASWATAARSFADLRLGNTVEHMTINYDEVITVSPRRRGDRLIVTNCTFRARPPK